MKHLLITSALLAVTASAAMAQDFELDLSFDEDFVFDDDSLAPAEDDFEFDDSTFFEEATAQSDGPTLSFALRAGQSTTSMGAMSTSASYAALDATGDMQLGDIGFLEFGVTATVDDPAGTASSSVALNKLILQNSTDQFSWKIGKFPIGWGEIEGTPVLDVLNGGLSMASLGSDTDDLPGQWFVASDFYLGRATVKAFVGLDAQAAHNAPAVQTGTQYEVGARVNIPIDQGQISLYGARLVPQSGVLNITATASSAEPYTLVGFSAHRAFDAALLEVDIAGKFGLERATATGFATDDRIDAAIGVEYSLTNATQLVASVAAQHWMDGAGSYFDFAPSGPAPSRQTNASYQMMLTTSALSDNLSLTAIAGGATDNSLSYQALQASYSLNSSLSVSSSLSQLQADPTGAYAPLDGTQSVSVEAKFAF